MKVVVLKNYETCNIALLAINEMSDIDDITRDRPYYDGYQFVKQLHGLEFDGLLPQAIFKSDKI